MTKIPVSETDSSVNAHARSNSNLLSQQQYNQRFRRTFSFINSNRKRAVQYCTLSKSKRNRRLSLNHQPKKSLTNMQSDYKSHEHLALSFDDAKDTSVAANVREASSLTSITNQLKQYAEEFKQVEDEGKSAVKLSKFKRLKQKFHMNSTQNNGSSSSSKTYTAFDFDQSLKDYIQKNREANPNNSQVNSELN